MKRHPYRYLAYGLIRELARTQSEIGFSEEPVDFVFDEQVQEQKKLEEAWAHFKANAEAPRHLLGAMPLFRDEKTVNPLQAADLIAGLTRLRWVEHESGQEPYDVPGASEAQRIPALTLVWTEELLRHDLAGFFRSAPAPATYTYGYFGCSHRKGC